MNERARWMNKGFSSSASGTNHQLFNASQDVVNHVVLSRGGPGPTKPMTNNFMPGANTSQMTEPNMQANAFDQYAY